MDTKSIYTSVIQNVDGYGLFSGKTGVAVYLFHCTRVYSDEQYEEFALAVVNEIQEAFTTDISYDYANGLAGFGSALCYLFREGFIKPADGDFFADFDDFFFNKVCFSEHTDLSWDTGILGIGGYLLNRMMDMPDCNNMDAVKIRHLLLLIQDVVFAQLEMNGYSYPYLNSELLPSGVIDDIRRFLRKILKVGLCPELTQKALYIVNGSGLPEYSVFEQLAEADSNNENKTMRMLLEQIATSKEESVVKQLALLQLHDMTLPAWWELFN